MEKELLEAVAETVSGLTKRWDRRYYLEKSAAHEAPTELYAAMADAGLFALGVPEEHGGAGGGVTAVAAVMEAMSRVGMPPMIYSLTSFSRQAIIRFGTPEQIETHVKATLTAERTFSFALTEPEAGTNSFAISTTATRRDDGSYVLKGQKVFISGADQADHMIVVARTTPSDRVENKSDGLSLFVIDAKSPGLSMSPLNIEWHAPERQFTVYFDDVIIPPEGLIGEEGKGAACLFESLNTERVVISAWTLGLGQFALAKAVEYAKVRAPWGAPIGQYHSVSHPLAKAKAQLEAARLMTYQAAAQIDQGLPAGDLSNMAKLLASEAADAAVDAALQTHGGSAFDADTDIVTIWPMVRILRIAPLNNEMILNYIAERVLGLPRSY
ncbi:acyl-CoA dehydrogenase family protein [Arthrobacter sp. ISL-28]|uniref:acyl-CoA dehydrogenase family protein n=1 Tax=Arthrobacter sp. ISL-28 TaxID=2819108 RepID=UPI001BE5A08F|nr:acyl-CoA dehydrogenase family protein [Arthrobacter sp. ISL-28]MBT2523321.1 acyl-CoA/acyl-ACP dehydrogenase [Arthrobacter sp. ISL-28]